MPVIGRPTKPVNALVAAATRRTIEQVRRQPASPQGDGGDLWDLYDRLGELGYGVGFKANAASKLTYYPAEKQDPSEDPQPVDQGPAVEAFNRLQGPLGEFADFVAELCIHLDVPGEGYLVGSTVDGEESFDVWSGEELAAATQQAGNKRHTDDVEAGTDPFVLRIWRPHPRRRALADSPLRRVRAEADQLILLGDMVTSIAQSRLPAKILGVPDELSFAAQVNDDGAQADGDPFIAELIDAMTAAVRDTRNAGRIVPLVIRGPGDRLAQLTVVDPARDLPEWVTALTERVIRRFAAGMDLPAEILLGLADVNHWTAWQVDESAYKQHVDPLIMLILDSITRGFLWPELEASGLGREQARRFVLWRDFTDLTVHHTLAEAVQLFDRGAVGPDFLRRVGGADNADAPTEQDPDLPNLIESVGALIRAGFDPEASLAAMGLGPIAHTGTLPITVQRAEDVPSVVEEPESAMGPDEVMPGPPPSPVTASSGFTVYGNTFTGEGNGIAITAGSFVPGLSMEGLARIDQTLLDKLTETCQSGLDRALERAGAKIRTTARKDRGITARIEGADNWTVAGLLGPALVERLQLTDDELIPGDVFDRTLARARRLFRQTQESARTETERILDQQIPRDPAEEETWVEKAVDFLRTALISLALARLFTPDPTPDPAQTGEVADGVVPAETLVAALTYAGGGTPSSVPGAPRGLAVGEHTRQVVEGAGYKVISEIWYYGDPSTRQTNFPPHQALNGQAVRTWTQPGLEVGQSYTTRLRNGEVREHSLGWLDVTHYFPGDHRGCRCTTYPIVELTSVGGTP